MAFIPIYTACSRCCGEGVAVLVSGPGATETEDPCTKCNGTGKFPAFYIELDDIADTLDDILDKCNDIKEVVDDL